MTILAVLALFMAWVSVGALRLQVARGGGILPAMHVSDETAAAGRVALRRAAWIALGVTGGVALVGLVVEPLHAATAEVMMRMLMFAACPLVVFVGGRPLIRRGVQPAPQREPISHETRTASLVVRDDEEILPRRWWAAPIGFLAIPVAALVATWSTGGTPSSQTVTVVVIVVAVATSFLLTYGAWAWLATSTPQDLSCARDPQALDAACRAFRRFLARGVFGMMTAIVAGAAAVAVAAIATDGDPAAQGAWCGGMGGALGAVAGVCGGLLGAFADRRRRAILELGGVPPEPGARSRRAPG